MSELTHLDRTGAANMVDVSDKPATARRARAEGRILMRPETVALIRSGDARMTVQIGASNVRDRSVRIMSPSSARKADIRPS